MQEKISERIFNRLIELGCPASEALTLRDGVVALELDASRSQLIRTQDAARSRRYRASRDVTFKKERKVSPIPPLKKERDYIYTIPSIPNGIEGAKGASGDLFENDSQVLSARDALWREGTRIMVEMTGLTESKAKRQIGMFLKLAKDDCARVLNSIKQAQSDKIIDPTSWIIAGLKGKPSGRDFEDYARVLFERRFGKGYDAD